MLINPFEKYLKFIDTRLKSFYLILKPMLSFNKFLLFYQTILENITRFTKVTADFVVVLLSFLQKIIPDPLTNVLFLAKLAIPLFVYSKLLLTFNSLITCPSFLIDLAQIYCNAVSELFNQSAIFFINIVNFFKENLSQYNSNKEAIDILKNELKSLKDLNKEQFQNICLENEKWRDAFSKYQKHLSEISAENLLQKEALNRLNLENTSLADSIKTMKTATFIDSSVKTITIAGNIFTLCINGFVLFQKLTGSGPGNNFDSNQMKLLVESVQSLVNRQNAEHVANISEQRAAESAQTGLSSAGLTGGRISFQDEFAS